jgi:hypothetical protein
VGVAVTVEVKVLVEPGIVVLEFVGVDVTVKVSVGVAVLV